MLQARMSEGDPRLYSPSRDVAHNFQSVMEIVAARLEDGAWPELDAHLKENDISMDDLGEACAAFCSFVANSVNTPEASMQEAMEAAGWFKCKTLAQTALMAVLGTVYAGIHFHGVREATLGVNGPAATVHELAETGSNFLAIVRVPRWKRRLRGAIGNFKRAMLSLVGRG